jgi:hypothetical protein
MQIVADCVSNTIHMVGNLFKSKRLGGKFMMNKLQFLLRSLYSKTKGSKVSRHILFIKLKGTFKIKLHYYESFLKHEKINK